MREFRGSSDFRRLQKEGNILGLSNRLFLFSEGKPQQGG